MKKIIITALCALTLFSCQKINPKMVATNNSDITLKKELKNINSKYSHSDASYKSFKEWCQIGVADVGGAWAGTWAGGKIGSLFGPHGATAGAVAGAVIVGAAASYGASGGIYTGGAIPDEVHTKISNIDVTATYPNPANNPYDLSVGQRHNQLLKYLTINNPLSGPSDAGTIYDNVALSESERIFYANKKIETANLYLTLKSAGSIQSTRNLLAQNIDDAGLLSVMNSYIDGVTSTTSLTDAMSITYDYENYITSNNTLTALQKNTLLQGFAVAKYSFNFWNQTL